MYGLKTMALTVDNNWIRRIVGGKILKEELRVDDGKGLLSGESDDKLVEMGRSGHVGRMGD